MSDATLPPRSSSADPVEEMDNGLDLSLPGGYLDAPREDAYMFAAREDGSGDSGGGMDNKQKRKRTSPKDQALLEAEYKQNPKPNKAARADIVEKVDLNEKEVQIWFQNRRQINRRKSRPLLPHEIAAFGLGGMAALSSDQDPVFQFGSSQNPGDTLSNSQAEPAVTQEHDETESGQDETEISQPEHIHRTPTSSQREKLSQLAENAILFMPSSTLKREGSGHSITDIVSGSVDDSVVKSFSSTPGYLANRWNNFNSSLSTPASSHIPTYTTPPIFTANQPATCPERIDESIFTPSSTIRLSLSLDGKAELITSSPSPPQQRAQRPMFNSPQVIPAKRMRPLQRSQSAYSLSSPAIPSMPSMPSMSSMTQASPSVRRMQSMAQASRSFVPHLPAGRSMDVRTWERSLGLESETRDALTMQAENESHGSAIAAISLIRSTSSSALKPNNNKRNMSALKPDASKEGKKRRFGAERLKMVRAQSSLARLQSTKNSSKQPADPSSYTKDDHMRSPSGDSDKENWEPNQQGANPRRRPLPSSRSARESSMRAAVLGDNHAVLSHATFGPSKSRKRKAATDTPQIFEDQGENENGSGEVEQFMRGISPSKKGDLDCVQGLLSLSQGNWR